MTSLLKARWPVFEFSIFLVVALIGWAEYQLYKSVKPQVLETQKALQREIEGERQLGQKWEQNAREEQRTINGLNQTVNGLQQAVTALTWQSNQTRELFTEVEGVFQGELDELHKAKLVDARTLPEFQRIQDEYTSIADAVVTNIDQLETALTSLTDPAIFRGRILPGKEPPEVTRFDEKCHQFNDWIVKQKERIGAERFPAKSQELQDKVAAEQLSAAGQPIRITKDMGNLLEDVSHVFTNYLEESKQMIANVRKDAPREAVSKRFENARVEAARLTDSAREARQSGEAIKAYMTAQLDKDPARRTAQQKTALKKFMAMRARLESNPPPNLALVSPTLNAALPDPLPSITKAATTTAVNPDRFPSLQPVLYSLVIAQVGLAIFLMVAIYRIVVVDKLRLQVYESATEGKLAHLGQLAAWLAHEIKQPLTAINVWLWTLQKGVREGSPEQTGTNAISKEIQRMDLIVKDFLRYTQPALPKLASVSAEPVLREVMDLLGPDLARHSIQVQLGALAKATFSADPQQLKQVLINLVKNAAESIQHDGQITLRARNARAPLRGQRADVVIIEVEDNGAGIPPEVQPRLFDPFFSTKEDGTGLGLPIAANIIEKHGGVLEFKTELGKGTTFAIVLPAEQAI